jgi:hypothetical protein
LLVATVVVVPVTVEAATVATGAGASDGAAVAEVLAVVESVFDAIVATGCGVMTVPGATKVAVDEPVPAFVVEALVDVDEIVEVTALGDATLEALEPFDSVVVLPDCAAPVPLDVLEVDEPEELDEPEPPLLAVTVEPDVELADPPALATLVELADEPLADPRASA